MNTHSPQFKRLAAIQGDIMFQASRRFLLENLPETQPAFAFRMFFFSSFTCERSLNYLLFNLSVFKRGKATQVLGSFHASDIPEFYGFDVLGFGVKPSFIGTDALGM